MRARQRFDARRQRLEWLAAVRRCLPGGWGLVLSRMGADFTPEEWSARSGIPEHVIRWILLERDIAIADET